MVPSAHVRRLTTSVTLGSPMTLSSLLGHLDSCVHTYRQPPTLPHYTSKINLKIYKLDVDQFIQRTTQGELDYAISSDNG